MSPTTNHPRATIGEPIDVETSESTALAVRQPTGIIPRSFAETREIAGVLADSTFLPTELRGRAPDVVARIMTGAELGLPPMASLRNVYIGPGGRPGFEVKGKIAACRRSGLLEYLKKIESNDTIATYEVKRRGEDADRSSFTIDEARRAGLVKEKGTWVAYPRNMLRWRCIGELLDVNFADVLAGIADETYDEAESVRPVAFTAPALAAGAAVGVAIAAPEAEAARTRKPKAGRLEAPPPVPEAPAPVQYVTAGSGSTLPDNGAAVVVEHTNAATASEAFERTRDEMERSSAPAKSWPRTPEPAPQSEGGPGPRPGLAAAVDHATPTGAAESARPPAPEVAPAPSPTTTSPSSSGSSPSSPASSAPPASATSSSTPPPDAGSGDSREPAQMAGFREELRYVRRDHANGMAAKDLGAALIKVKNDYVGWSKTPEAKPWVPSLRSLWAETWADVGAVEP